ncbi:MAG TPA: hypothetical protein VGR41_09685 [Actinomycetota bacterium]|jgi:hypothetical protein|nr:hypothetical protein [Actinomycetota bacterium]
MQESSSAYPPEGSGGRGLFPRRISTDPQHPTVVVSLERAVEERLEEGLQALEEHAAALMREIAKEMWRASGGDTSEAQERILSYLSRDQAIRSLIASSDERFQTLAVRTAKFEDVLTEVALASRATREAIQESAAAIREVAESPAVHGVEDIRNQLELVERHIAAAFQHLDERDKTLVDGIQERIQAHGELIARETTRIVEAMQGYVQSGTEAVGRLAMRVEGHAEAFAVHDDDVAGQLRKVIRQEIGGFAEQLEMTGEKVGIGQRDEQQLVERLQHSLESRVYGLAQLVRSDSEALKRHIDQTAAAQEERMTAAIDEGLAGLSRTAELQVSSLTMAVSSTVERQVSGISDSIEERMVDIADVVARRAADIAVANTFDQSLERMASHVDDRVTALAKLIRADNRAIAEALTKGGGGEETDTSKQTLRAVKELQASLAGDVDRRFTAMTEQLHSESQSTVETMAKVAEVLAEKMDRLSVRVDEGYGNDLQIVIERMSDAISAISGLGGRQR